MEIKNMFNKGDLIKNDNFNKDAYLNMLNETDNESIALVTFEPGCVNRWHSHSVGQILICTNGRGYYQEKGEAPIELNEGDTIEIKKDIIHWHGAAKDNEFSHIAISRGIPTWYEHVDINEYNKLK